MSISYLSNRIRFCNKQKLFYFPHSNFTLFETEFKIEKFGDCIHFMQYPYNTPAVDISWFNCCLNVKVQIQYPKQTVNTIQWCIITFNFQRTVSNLFWVRASCFSVLKKFLIRSGFTNFWLNQTTTNSHTASKSYTTV